MAKQIIIVDVPEEWRGEVQVGNVLLCNNEFRPFMCEVTELIPGDPAHVKATVNVED